MADSRDVTSGHRLACIFLSMPISCLVGSCGFHGALWKSQRRLQRPEAAIEAYADALARRDTPRAYARLREVDKRALPPADYGRLLARDAAEAKELAAWLAHAGPARVTARVKLDDGSELELELAGDHFVLVDPLARFYGQSSPRQALRSFVRAVQRSRWDVVLALMPNAAREGLDAATLGRQLEARRQELDRMTALLSASLEAPMEVVGDRATMPYGESYTARLVREGQQWKLEDPE